MVVWGWVGLTAIPLFEAQLYPCASMKEDLSSQSAGVCMVRVGHVTPSSSWRRQETESGEEAWVFVRADKKTSSGMKSRNREKFISLLVVVSRRRKCAVDGVWSPKLLSLQKEEYDERSSVSKTSW